MQPCLRSVSRLRHKFVVHAGPRFRLRQEHQGGGRDREHQNKNHGEDEGDAFLIGAFHGEFSLFVYGCNNAVTVAGMGCARVGSTKLAVAYTSTTFRGATFSSALVSG